MACSVRHQTEEVQARFVFEQLDTDQSTNLDALELQKLLLQWGLPAREVEAYLKPYDNALISFDAFYNRMKPIWQFAY